ncbi:hypothetical protein BKP45_02045 [Anaerobacillus alkalidiazotrophicus]|uniref:Uncharacterized protein n=1 Tax=Anaerobacillus alkalidiazotrophicus TaxID=472963 RepID=A0A1S2MAD5_9BACI|nr:hypothetical protein BKP45_02045 [Anaerobacillus alkalidiazotrophicus]
MGETFSYFEEKITRHEASLFFDNKIVNHERMFLAFRVLTISKTFDKKSERLVNTNFFHRNVLTMIINSNIIHVMKVVENEFHSAN